jgi:hypothetical protein
VCSLKLNEFQKKLLIKERIQMTSFGFTRSVRTSSSEVYYIFLEDTRVGTLNAHYTKIVHADLFLEVDLSDSMREELFDSIYRILDVIELEDIYFSVNRGVHETIFSNTVDHSQLPPTRGDIQKLHKEISSHAGKHKRVVSHLNEQVAQEYFEIKGYDVVKATSEQDHSKIDLIALNESRVLPI